MTMSSKEFWLRRTVVCASGLIYWGGVLIQGRRIRKRIGRSPNLRPRGAREKALWLGWFLVILAWIGQPLLVSMTTIACLLPGMLQPVSLAFGLGLILLGYVGTLWAYLAMGDTWRIGINTGERMALISNGPFRWVRHPIYVLQLVMLVGTALLLPTSISFVAIALHYFCARLKASDEEIHLREIHGTAYGEYLSRTGRFFPRLPRNWQESAATKQTRTQK
jgi:protein-S-isoprenylcysteine O-methyltransferase Ste14